MYTIELIRDKVRECELFPRELANIITSYALMRGDILLYMPIAYSEYQEYDAELPYCYHRFTDDSVDISLIIEPKEDKCHFHYDEYFYTRTLSGADDPIADLIEDIKMQHSSYDAEIYSFAQDIVLVIEICLKHLLRE